MKLYTEEQVKEMIDDAHNGIDGYYDIFKKHSPIELPSDEEIYLEARRYERYHESMNELEAECSAARYHGHMQGAKWMRDKILNK